MTPLSVTQRLDKWLWCARFYKSRSLAADACRSRHVRLDGRVIDKANAQVKPGSVISFPWGDRVRVIRVAALADRRGPAPEARDLYEDLSPPPAPRAKPAYMIIQEATAPL
jgi:ribosome-associated heat shock protein Hsp15